MVRGQRQGRRGDVIAWAWPGEFIPGGMQQSPVGMRFTVTPEAFRHFVSTSRVQGVRLD